MSSQKQVSECTEDDIKFANGVRTLLE